MTIIGITGPSGAGKGICCEYLSSLGISCIDTDAVYHELISAPSPCVQELATAFGKEIVDKRGAIDRKALAAIVFSDSSHQKTRLLNQITHKYVRIETLRLLDTYKNRGDKAVAIDAPLLFEANFDDLCDFCIAVIAPRSLRLSRIIARDSLSKERADARLDAQKADDYYTSRSKYTIMNDSDKENTLDQLKFIFATEGLIS